MQEQGLNGTHDWIQETVALTVPPTAGQLCFGALVTSGTGSLWVDDLALAP
jgi:hypothetical protein